MRRYLELPITTRHAWDSYAVVDSALEQLEQGQFLEASLLTDAVYTDDRVIGCLSTRINGLFGLPLDFKYPGQDDAHGSAKPADDDQGQDVATVKVGEEKDPPEVLALKKEICELAEKNWEKMVPGAAAREQVRWGIMLNAGVGQLEWDWGRDGLLWPTLKTWNSQWIFWRWDTRSYWLNHADGTSEIHPGDGCWVLFAPNGHNHGWLYGLIRALGKLWLDRIFTVRDWARASEKYSLGILKAKVPAGSNADDKKDFVATVTNMPNETVVLLPQGEKDQGSFDLEMMETDAMTHPDFFQLRIHQLDVSIAVCLLGQNLSTEIEKGGSRAAAQVHDNVRGDFLKADDEVWSSMVRTQILTPWVRHNWGDIIESMGREVTEFVPEVCHTVDPPEDLQKKADAILKIGQAIEGLAGTEADIHALLQQHGIPTLDEKATPQRPPPGADVNERPPAPGGVGTPQDDPATAPGNGDRGAQAMVDTSLRRARGPITKPGQRKGRVFADDLVDAAVKAGAAAVESRKKALLHIVQTARDFDVMKEQIKALYFDAPPSELRGVVEKAIAAAQLLGHASARVDHREAGK
jgi:phage gp29-like protein